MTISNVPVPTVKWDDARNLISSGVVTLSITKLMFNNVCCLKHKNAPTFKIAALFNTNYLYSVNLCWCK